MLQLFRVTSLVSMLIESFMFSLFREQLILILHYSFALNFVSIISFYRSKIDTIDQESKKS